MLPLSFDSVLYSVANSILALRLFFDSSSFSGAPPIQVKSMQSLSTCALPRNPVMTFWFPWKPRFTSNDLRKQLNLQGSQKFCTTYTVAAKAYIVIYFKYFGNILKSLARLIGIYILLFSLFFLTDLEAFQILA